jgi:N6-adenosine-specific RNA methylase IME4
MKGQKYGAILADPPWDFKAWSAKGEDRAASQHYAVMNLEELKELPVWKLAAPDCALFLWATNPLLPEALEVVKSWGFTYRTLAFSWAKTCKVATDKPFMGLGYWTRANVELCLLSTRGHPKRLARDVRQLIIEPLREHSRKPEIRDSIERLVAGPYCELFSRSNREGWDCFGEETGKFDDRPDAANLL